MDEGCIYVMDGLERNSFLKNLNLRHNYIDHAGAVRIGKIFESSKIILKKLNLSENRLGDAGGTLIAKAFAKNQCLTKLILYDTEIKDECAKEFTQTLKINKHLQHINLGWNTFNPKYLHQINRLQKDNISNARQESCP